MKNGGKMENGRQKRKSDKEGRGWKRKIRKEKRQKRMKNDE